jgi:tRNA (adenine37-N6)-methyltransferase
MLESKSFYKHPAVSECTFKVIATIRSDYRSKSSIPRQPNLITGVESSVIFARTPESEQWLRGIDEFTHLWVLFLFHANGISIGRPVGNLPTGRSRQARGVLSTRTPYRPNPIGMSAVRFVALLRLKTTIELQVEGGDFLDGTPVLDIKPYVPYADCLPQAKAEWAVAPEPSLTVRWGDTAREVIEKLPAEKREKLSATLVEIIGHDPRPFHYRFQKGESKHAWQIEHGNYRIFFTVLGVEATIDRVLEEHKSA